MAQSVKPQNLEGMELPNQPTPTHDLFRHFGPSGKHLVGVRSLIGWILKGSAAGEGSDWIQPQRYVMIQQKKINSPIPYELP